MKASALFRLIKTSNPYPLVAGVFSLLCLIASLASVLSKPKSAALIPTRTETGLEQEPLASGQNGPDFLQISEWHLLGQDSNPVSNTETPPETQLQLKLMGVFKLANHPTATRAIIQSEDNVQKIYRLNETLPGGAVLEAIDNDKATLLVDNQRESLSLQKFNDDSQPAVEDPSLSAQ
ncbi:hypothetical protein JCM14076_27390 [Methylosoma difficile]